MKIDKCQFIQIGGTGVCYALAGMIVVPGFLFYNDKVSLVSAFTCFKSFYDLQSKCDEVFQELYKSFCEHDNAYDYRSSLYLEEIQLPGYLDDNSTAF